MFNNKWCNTEQISHFAYKHTYISIFVCVGMEFLYMAYRWIWSCLQSSLGEIHATNAWDCRCEDSERLEIYLSLKYLW